MPYYVMCRVSDGATATRESLLTRHGVPVLFGTIAEAEAIAEDLRHERQHARGGAECRYWVVECPTGDVAGRDAVVQVPSRSE